VLPLNMVENSASPLQTLFGTLFHQCAVQTGHLLLEKGSSDNFCSHVPQPPHGVLLRPYLA
jgi:hypothetical protein